MSFGNYRINSDIGKSRYKKEKYRPGQFTRFFVSAALGAMVIAALCAMAMGFFSVFWPLAIFFPIVLIGIFVSVPLFGASAGLRGFVASPVVLLTLAFLWNFADRQLQNEVRRDIAAQNPATLLVPDRQHLQLAFDDEGQSYECREECIAYIASAPGRSVAIRREHEGWRVWWRQDPRDCGSPAYAQGTLAALRLGFVDFCLATATRATIEDAVLRRRSASYGGHTPAATAQMPKHFIGDATEFVEITNGVERRLGIEFRGVAVRTAPWLMQWAGGSARSASDTIREGPPNLPDLIFQQAERVAHSPRFSGARAPMPSVLAAIEPFFDDKDQAGIASLTWSFVATSGAKDYKDDVSQRIGEFLDSSNRSKIDAALNTLFSVPQDVKIKYRERVLMLAFAPMTYDKNNIYFGELRAHLRIGDLGIPASVRDMARARLKSGRVTNKDEGELLTALSS